MGNLKTAGVRNDKTKQWKEMYHTVPHKAVKPAKTPNIVSKRKYKKFLQSLGSRELRPEFVGWGTQQGRGPGENKRRCKVHACL